MQHPLTAAEFNQALHQIIRQPLDGMIISPPSADQETAFSVHHIQDPDQKMALVLSFRGLTEVDLPALEREIELNHPSILNLTWLEPDTTLQVELSSGQMFTVTSQLHLPVSLDNDAEGYTLLGEKSPSGTTFLRRQY